MCSLLVSDVDENTLKKCFTVDAKLDVTIISGHVKNTDCDTVTNKQNGLFLKKYHFPGHSLTH